MSDYDQNDEQHDDDDQNDADEIESSASEQPTEVLDREVLHLQYDIEYLTTDLNRADADFTDEHRAVIRLQPGSESQSKKR